MKRIFTQVLNAGQQGATTENIVPVIATSMVAQEDMYIRGVQLSVLVGGWTTILALAGVEGGSLEAELTQAGLSLQPGSICSLRSSSILTVQGGITPNATQVGSQESIYVDFDLPILVKEEGSINLLMGHQQWGVVTINYSARATIYWTKEA